LASGLRAQAGSPADAPHRPYHAHDEVQKLVPDRVYELDIEIWPTCIVAPAGYRLALSIRGRDYDYPSDLGWAAGRIGQPARGVGPFPHADEADRPGAIYGGAITLHSDPDDPPYLLLPIVPASG
jgi:predicted acyl esterase